MSTVKLTIDGKEVEVAKGTRVIEAAKMADQDVPFYCYHPGLSVAGNCRMCLVEIEKMPKLQIACHMQAQEGMVVNTQTERVLKTRQHVLEFLLVNHPLDCPVCDQAGECWLQDYYMRHGLHDSRLNENKTKKPKAQSIGPTVMLDAERCILCSRCVRFCDEISGTSELGIINRGDHSEITVFPDKELNNPYSGNVVDICPVGALTDKDFRFKTRVWYLKSEESLCNGCSRGCNISVQYNLDRPHHAKGERIKRLKPRYNPDVNTWWMCDEGRYGYKFHEHNRITAPLMRKGDEIKESGWEEVLGQLVQGIRHAEGRVGVFVSPQVSNEELFLAREFFSKHLKLGQVHLVKARPDGFEDDVLIKADKNPNSKGAELLGFAYNDAAVQALMEETKAGKIDGWIVLGQNLFSQCDEPSVEAALKQVKWTAFIGSNHNVMSENSTYVLPAATYVEKEGTFTNFEGKTQHFNQVLEPLGEAKPLWQILMEMAKAFDLNWHYEEAEEIFHELSLNEGAFKAMTYEALNEGSTNIRQFAAPTVPQLEQDSNLIFFQEKAKAPETQPQTAEPS